MTPIKPSDMGGDEEYMGLPGKLVRTLIKKFCEPNRPDDPLTPQASLGIGRSSMAATDKRNRAVIAGQLDMSYQVTDRRCAALEADRAEIYGEGYDAGRVLPTEDLIDPENAPPDGPFPDVAKIIRQVDKMKPLAILSAEALRDVSALAVENREAVECMRQHDTPGTLHYVDPPYVRSTRNVWRKTGSYRFEMTDEQHRDDHASLLCWLQEQSPELLARFLKESGYSGDVWTIASQSFRGAHFATYPEKLARTCILAGCPVGGVVLDLFAGSCRTLKAAIELGRKAIGIELSAEYIPLGIETLRSATPSLEFEVAS